jgi:hypothetical protein
MIKVYSMSAAEDDQSEYINAYNSGDTFDLMGRLQCWIAAKALKYTGINPETYHDMVGALKVHAFYFEDCEENEVGFRYTCVGEEDYRESVKSDILFSLYMLETDTDITDEAFIAADALIGIIAAK